MERALKTYTKKERNYYLLGLLGQNIIYNVIGVGLALYYTEALYVPPGIVALLMLVARLWDACNDFIMGVIMDRTRSKLGKARPYLLAAPLLIMVGTVGAFSATFDYHQNPTLTVVFIYVTYILWGMIYTMGISRSGDHRTDDRKRGGQDQLLSQPALPAPSDRRYLC